MSASTSTATYLDRINRARLRMDDAGIDVLLVSVGRDLPYLTGYEAMPLERLTMLVVPNDGDATLVVPRLEAPRVVEQPGVFTLLPWNETDDPDRRRRRPRRPAGHGCGRRHDVGQVPGRTAGALAVVVHPLRAFHRGDERLAHAQGRGRDRRAGRGRRCRRRDRRRASGRRIPLAGRTEAAVSADLGARILAEGHQRVNFAIVAAGENAASPHHHASDRMINDGEIVLCDFGGTMDGYCSDITRCVFLGDPPAEVAEAYAVLHEAQRAAVLAGTVGTPCEEVDRVARRIITAAGYGEYFIHRTGHGIGMEEHEDPYMVEGNGLPLEPGHAFSVEPGIYLSGRWGMRLEDIVVATDAGPAP